MKSLSELVRLEDPSFYWDNPYPVLQRLRQEDPVFFYEPLNMWVMSKYEDIRHVGRTPEVFSNRDGIFFHDFRYGDVTKVQFFHSEAENIGLLGPPRHNEIRKIAGAAFTPKVLAGMRDRIRDVARSLLDPIKPGEVVNWSAQIAEPLPLLVIAILMGISVEEYDKLKYYSDEIIKVGLDASPEEISAISARIATSDDYFETFLALRDQNPTSDLIGILQQARREGQLSTPTVLTLLRAIMTAGNETTRNTLNGAIIALAQNPDQTKALAAQPTLVKLATEEFLRWVSPVRGFGRTIIQDVEFKGRHLKSGQRLLNFFMSGNRDADAFEKPEEFNVTRQRNTANVALGFGEHFCIGAAVARLEINILFEELINRFSHVQLVGSPDRDLKQLNFYAWENVQVIFS
jgi:cytochrome P450